MITNQPSDTIYSSIKQTLILLLAFGMAALLFAGCDSPNSANEDEENLEKETKTFDLILSSDSATKIGTATTEILTPDDDAYIDEGFFITLNITDSDFEPPYDIDMNTDSGFCGTFNVQDGDKAEMPCDYDEFLSDPSSLAVTSEDGSGIEAYPEE